jgi:peptidyl-prolyl cis-trans isomerase A (cyclophilin A)
MKYFIIAFCFSLWGCSQPTSKYPQVRILTSMGDIELELYTDKAPKTAQAFLQHVDSGYYTQSSFYRVVLQEGLSANQNTGLIQGGIFLTNDKKFPHPPKLPHEHTGITGLHHNTGTLSMARNEPGTADTEFFICIGDQTQYDYGNSGVADQQGYSAFGKVTKGMPIVRLIQQQKAQGDQFSPKIIIYKIERF